MHDMNSLRDPFAIRSKPPLAILVQRLASPTTDSNTKLPTVEAIAENTQAKHESVAEPMAFAVPRHVPSFDNPDREREDRVWSAVTGVPARGGNTALGNITGAASSLFKDKGLPMYKDKPYYYTSSHRRTRIWKRKRYWGVFLIAIFGLYWLGFLSGDGQPKGMQFLKGAKSPWKSEDVINWEERRDKVKQAFLQSWEGYERNAWGTVYM